MTESLSLIASGPRKKKTAIEKILPKGKIDVKGGFAGKRYLASARLRAEDNGYTVVESKDHYSQSGVIRQIIVMAHPYSEKKIEFQYVYGNTADDNRFTAKVIS